MLLLALSIKSSCKAPAISSSHLVKPTGNGNIYIVHVVKSFNLIHPGVYAINYTALLLLIVVCVFQCKYRNSICIPFIIDQDHCGHTTTAIWASSPTSVL